MIKIVERTEDRIRLMYRPSWWMPLAFAVFGVPILFHDNIGWMGRSIGVIFLLVAIGLHFVKEECVFDKRRDLVLVKRAQFPPSPEQYRLSDVAAFFVSNRYGTSHSHHHHRNHQTLAFGLEMRLKSGLEIPLCCEQSSLGLKQRQNIVVLLEHFRRSIQYPRLDDEPSPPLALVRASDMVCVICRLSCGNGPALKDDRGNYYHPTCYDESKTASSPS